jgi:UDP-glucose 4-epimerase
MNRALVTGGAGFIGSNITKRLLEEGWGVDIVDDLSNGHVEFIREAMRKHKKSSRFIQADFAHPVVLEHIRNKRYDVIFHEAAVPRVAYSVEHPALTTDTNINKTVQLMEAARDNVRRIVFASSSSVYGGADNLPTLESEPKTPVSPYALQKLVIEDFAKLFNKLYGLDMVCLRYFNVFGPNQYGDSPYSTAVSAWCHAVKEGVPLRSDGDGEQTRDLCYIDNVVDANLIVANYKGDL